MRSFIFCTSFITNRSPHLSAERWERWIAYYDARKALLGAEHIVLIDDASPAERIPPTIEVIDIAGGIPKSLPGRPAMFRFSDHYGRLGLTIFPGWWRSFTFSVVIAQRYAFSRIIHCESDAFVLSHRMMEHMQQIEEGWIAFWCPRYRFPETGIQVICRDAFEDLAKFYTVGERLWFRDVFPERVLPFSSIERDYVGDRYGEFRNDFPAEADYVCQTTPAMWSKLPAANNVSDSGFGGHHP